jgi:hypothetical protein
VRIGAAVFIAAALALHAATPQAAEDAKPEMAPEARPVPHEEKAFGPDPSYADKPYDTGEQLRIYGGKSQLPTPRPLLELGRPIYRGGPYDAPGTAFGRKNPTDQAFSIYGDWRTALAYNDEGAVERGILATRLNLDVDWKLTATERLHAFFRPLDHGADFTRCERVSGGSGTSCRGEMDAKAETLFFEGDLGAMAAGWRGRYSRFDLPFALGKIPLLFQNGVWLEDAFTGLAFTIPGRNSRALDIANMDVTFFTGFADVDSGGVRDAAARPANGEADVFGLTSFIEANQGYWELGYAYTDAERELGDQSYHNVAVAFSRRYGGWLSNSVRLIHNFGQQRNPGQRQTADGTLLLIENSLVTRRPLTLVPYLNLFFGNDRPQSVARDPGAGGILKNTGINFETDGLTGFPKLDDTANNTAGGALGLQYLFDLQQQVVVEWATVQTRGDAADRVAPGAQNALGVRYQRNLDKAWLIRADGIVAERKNDKDIGGVRFEVRKKF